jgi:hypothetical protein
VERADILAIDGISIAGHSGPGSIADIAVRRLLRLPGTMRNRQIASTLRHPGAQNTLTPPAPV